MRLLWWSLLALGLLLLGAWAYRRGQLAAYYRTLFFFRFHLLVMLFLLVFPFVAQDSPLFHGLFVFEQVGGIVWVAALALIASWVVMASAIVTLTYGLPQFGVELPSPRPWVIRFRVPLFGLLALPTVGTVWWQSPPPWWAKGVGVLLGVAAAVIVVGLGIFFYRLSVPPGAQRFDLFFGITGWIPAAVTELDLPRLLHLSRVLDAAQGRLSALRRFLGPGYVDDVGRLRPGHLALFVFLLVVVAFYWIGYWWLAPTGWLAQAVPALAYILFLTIPLTLGLSTAAFLCDRKRIPVGLAIAALSLAFYTLTDTDHYFLVSPDSRASMPVPEPQPPASTSAAPGIVVVSAAGGGIQASAWTARVLAGLQEDLGAEFARAIRFVSAVSGGAVGTMYFVDRFTAHGPPDLGSLDRVVQAACSSSLDAVAWGVAYPELLRLVWPVPIAKKFDRGWALEHSWRRHLSDADATLNDWRGGVVAGWRPATAFNATIAETGERLLLSTDELSPTGAATTFAERYRGGDIAVVRAARLAATFPYVTPMARAMWSRTREDLPLLPVQHVADGGYYDNLAVATLLDWLLEYIARHNHRPQRILVIRIEPSPSDPVHRPSGAQGPAATAANPGAGWLSETLGPVLAMLSVRTSSQVSRGDVELRMLRELSASAGLEITEALFVPTHPGPLSWHLTHGQRRDIDKDWETARTGAAMRTVFGWWRRDPPASPPTAIPRCSSR